MSVQLSTGLRNGMLNAAGFNVAFANSVIEVYTGPQPINADAAVQGTLLGVFTKSAGAFVAGVSTNGLNFAAPAAGVVAKDSNAWQVGNGSGTAGWMAAGQAGWFRLKGNAADGGSGADTTHYRLDGSVATIGGDLNLSTVTAVVGAPSTIDVFQFTLPGS